jgi:hypothetical protein
MLRPSLQHADISQNVICWNYSEWDFTRGDVV